MLSVICAECRITALYAERHYAECRYAECRGAHEVLHSGELQPYLQILNKVGTDCQ